MLKVFQKLLLSISLLFSIGAQCQTLPIQPSNNELPASLGKAGNAPVLKALAVLIPSKYTVAVKTSVPENTILKWEASPNWFAVLSDAVATANLKMTMSEKDKKIVQQWYFGEEGEASIVTIKLFADKNKTSLELRHTNIPEEDYENIVAGWNEQYMGSLIEFYQD